MLAPPKSRSEHNELNLKLLSAPLPRDATSMRRPSTTPQEARHCELINSSAIWPPAVRKRRNQGSDTQNGYQGTISRLPIEQWRQSEASMAGQLSTMGVPTSCYQMGLHKPSSALFLFFFFHLYISQRSVICRVTRLSGPSSVPHPSPSFVLQFRTRIGSIVSASYTNHPLPPAAFCQPQPLYFRFRADSQPASNRLNLVIIKQAGHNTSLHLYKDNLLNFLHITTTLVW
jgi:hypothetical protein